MVHIGKRPPCFSRIGDLVNISSYNFYQLISGLLNPTGSLSPLIADGSLDPPYQIGIVLNNLTFIAQPNGYYFSQVSGNLSTISNSTSSNLAVIYISQPQLNDQGSTPTNWYRLGIAIISANQGPGHVHVFNFTNQIVPKGLMVSPGGYYSLRAISVNSNSKVPSVFTFSPPVESVIIPPYELPAIVYDDNPFNSFSMLKLHS